MGQKSGPAKDPTVETLKDIGHRMRKLYSAEEKIRITQEGLRSEA